MKKKYTTEQKKEYFAGLRQKWTDSKKQMSEHEKGEIAGMIEKMGLSISPYSFFFVSLQMKSLGMDGLPYVDCKTFDGWRASGFCVKKGEASKIHGITWIRAGNEKDQDDNDGFLFPKSYNLFHRSQVGELA